MDKIRFNFNISEFTWFVLLIINSLYFFDLVHSNDINMFVTPAISKYVIFASAMLLILALFQIPKIFKIKHDTPKFGYLIFIIPLIISGLIDPTGLNQQIADSKGVTTVTQSSSYSNKINKIMNKSGEIILNESNYFNTISELNDNPNKFKNHKIILTGFVYKDMSTKNNQFIIARLLMTCCAADTQVVGFLCDYNGINLNKDAWIKVTGIVDTIKYNDTNSNQTSTIPIIRVKSVEQSSPPKSKYIYINNTN